MNVAIKQPEVVTLAGDYQQSIAKSTTSNTKNTKISSGDARTSNVGISEIALNTVTLAFNQRVANKALQKLIEEIQCADDHQVDKDFLPRFSSILQQHGVYALGFIEHLLWNHGRTGWVIADILSLVGKVNRSLLYEQRIKLLHDALNSPSPAVRDGALSGLASLRDISSSLHLQLAASRELMPDLKRDMIRLVSRLKGK